MHYFGIFLGWTLVAGFVLESIKYLLKIINQKEIMLLPKESQLRRNYTSAMGLIFRTHQYIPLYLITILLIHFLFEVIHQGFYLTGFIAACLMISQIAIGIYGTIVKNKKKDIWLYAHRTITVLLLFTIILHIITVWGLPAD